MTLRLRPPRSDDEEAFRAAHRSMAGEYVFAHDGVDDLPWDAYLAKLDARRRGLVDDDFVAATFLVADVGGEIVGRVSVRHELDERLAVEGGHIGYVVLPGHRRRGDATEMLRQALVVARAAGVDRALLTCDDDNVGSVTVIERCGGVLDGLGTNPRNGKPLRRYRID